MKLRIEKPDWSKLMDHRMNPNGHTLSQAQVQWLNEAWQECVEPINKMLEAGVEVSGLQSEKDGAWTFTTPREMKPNSYPRTHRALLINVQEIKKETPEDVLRDYMALSESYPQKDWEELEARAKKVLGE